MPWFNGHRSLAEQMRGLDPALAECKGKRVLDVGCAEALISLEFWKHGAMVDAFDNNVAYVAAASENAGHARGLVKIVLGDMNAGLPKGMKPPYDIVLALAVLHKAPDVTAATRLLARACSDLMVIRLPIGCTGVIQAKHGGSFCNLLTEMPAHRFKLERTENGPRDELVQYWRKR